MNIITHKAEHTKSTRHFMKNCSYISEKKTILDSCLLFWCQTPSAKEPTGCTQVLPIFCSQIIQYQQGFGWEGHQPLFPGDTGCKDLSPPPFLLCPSKILGLIDTDASRTLSHEPFSEEETAFFIRLKRGINNISKEKQILTSLCIRHNFSQPVNFDLL